MPRKQSPKPLTYHECDAATHRHSRSLPFSQNILEVVEAVRLADGVDVEGNYWTAFEFLPLLVMCFF
jgi:hypothetical protein